MGKTTQGRQNDNFDVIAITFILLGHILVIGYFIILAFDLI